MSPLNQGRILRMLKCSHSEEGRKELNLLAARRDGWLPCPEYEQGELMVEDWFQAALESAHAGKRVTKRELPNYVGSLDILWAAEDRRGLHGNCANLNWLFRIWREAFDFVWQKSEKSINLKVQYAAALPVHFRVVAFIHAMDRFREIFPDGIPGATNTHPYRNSDVTAEVGDAVLFGKDVYGDIRAFSRDGTAVIVARDTNEISKAAVHQCVLINRP